LLFPFSRNPFFSQCKLLKMQTDLCNRTQYPKLEFGVGFLGPCSLVLPRVCVCVCARQTWVLCTHSGTWTFFLLFQRRRWEREWERGSQQIVRAVFSNVLGLTWLGFWSRFWVALPGLFACQKAAHKDPKWKSNSACVSVSVCVAAVFVSICVSPGGNSLRCLMHERQMKNELNTVANYMDQKANFEGGLVEGGGCSARVICTLICKIGYWSGRHLRPTHSLKSNQSGH